MAGYRAAEMLSSALLGWLLLGPARAEVPHLELWTVSPTGDAAGAWGHAWIRVRTEEPKSDRVFGYGRLVSPSGVFLLDLLAGTLTYRAEVQETRTVHRAAEAAGRTVLAQAIDLPAPRATALVAELEADTLPDRTAIAYDPVDQNCATRLRDLLDRHAFEGAWSRAAAARPGRALPDQSTELLADRPVFRWWVHGGIGRSVHAPRDGWSAMFAPRSLRLGLAEVREGTLPVDRPPGVKLGRPKVLAGPEDGDAPRPVASGAAAWAGAALAWLALALAAARPGPRADAVVEWVGGAWGLVSGLLGCALVALAMNPSPVFQDNLVLTALHPALLLLPALISWSRDRAWARGAIGALALVPLAGLAAQSAWGQPVTVWAGPSALVLCTVWLWALRRGSAARHRPSDRGDLLG